LYYRKCRVSLAEAVMKESDPVVRYEDEDPDFAFTSEVLKTPSRPDTQSLTDSPCLFAGPVHPPQSRIEASR
jgi:hypothetical protein